MNERIKSLIERAEYQAKKQSGYEDWEVYVPPDSQIVFQKFAELIVRECADVGSKFSQAHPEDIRYQIKRRFGVKE